MKDLINCENKPMYLNISENYKTQKLPSIRKSAEIFDVSIITIKSAYQLLEKFEIIIANPKIGYIISDNA
ncbi:helix-turn-helix domain-containing protein [Staphylococcus capitis]|uniref:GntR family transcriptional regulator n=1 Tax=Staphylococcus capitis TaxID=29388 RepID=UPI00066C7D42|nr:GntR family transcriptional regulator [Staphylococcus capitis]MCK6221702.1 GntR family transcriptional regulator [Staphylococcus capitis]